MWITVTPGREAEPHVLLPPRLRPPPRLVLRYGQGEAAVSAGVAAADPAAGATMAAPAPVTIAPGVIERLRIRTEPVYRVHMAAGVLEIGPVLGLMLGNRTHWYDEAYLGREPERVEAVYPHTGGLFCAFSPRSVSCIDRVAYGLYYDPCQGRWRYGNLPLPAIIHRRSFRHSASAVMRLQQGLGLRMFNSRRFDKWELDQLLRQDQTFRRYLPETVRVERAHDVLGLLGRHGAVVLKPADLSRGRGLLFAAAGAGGVRLHDYRSPGAPQVRDLSLSQLGTLVRRELVGRRYLCQERIDLATVAGAPFDIRVVMQRSPHGHWVCNGIECRLASQGNLVTNIAMGGRALWLSEAIGAAFSGAVETPVAEGLVIELAERLCRLLDRTGESFAEFGVDAALDRDGRPWLIEANVLPTFKGFLALDPRIYRRLLAAPLLYAATAAGFAAPAATGAGAGEEGSFETDL